MWSSVFPADWIPPLALLVAARAFDMLNIPRSQIHAITMPCFGTTDRTYQNACQMTRKLGASLKEIDIKASVTRHFEDIGHDISVHDVTYENGQARERTQILMDIANQVGGMVIGTGDMSELALGWATYNGDHMSMYGVNVSVPKTLVRHLVRYYADACGEEELKGSSSGCTGYPGESGTASAGERRHLPEDRGSGGTSMSFMISSFYYVLRFGFKPSRIYRMALQAFEGEYDRDHLKMAECIFTVVSLPSSSSVPACRMVRRSVPWPYLREEICVCRVTRQEESGWRI